MPADPIHVTVTFKFTLRRSEGGYRRLVFGANRFMTVGEIYKGCRPWMPKDHMYSAKRYWSGGPWKSFASLGEARKWIEDGFRAQILGEVGR
jgi:hypothetical protein